MVGTGLAPPGGWLSAINKTKGSLLGDRITVADTSLSRFIGLLGRRSLSPGDGLLIKPSNGVHTFGMRFPIDVLMLDQAGVVVSVHERLRPFRMTRINWRVSGALELPSGVIASSHTSVGDLLVLTETTRSS